MVYETEIDPGNHNSVLRTEDREFFSRLCEDEGFVRAAAEAYERHIRRESILEEDLEELKHNAEKDIGKCDFSLILLGILMAQEGDAIIVTDDTDLTKVVRKLFQGGSLVTKGVEYRTSSLSPEGVLEFIRDLHRQCTVSNEVWAQNIYALHEHYNTRYSRGEINDDRYAEIMELLSPIMRIMANDCREKEVRDIGQEIFGDIVEL